MQLYYKNIFITCIGILTIIDSSLAASTEDAKKFKYMARIKIVAHGFVAADFNYNNPRKAFGKAAIDYVNVSTVNEDQYFINTIKIATIQPPATEIMFQINCEDLSDAHNVSNKLRIINYDSYTRFSSKNVNNSNITIPINHVSFKSILNDHFANLKHVKGKQLIATKIDLRVNFGIINYPIINTNFLYSIMTCAFLIGIYTVISSMQIGGVWDPFPDPYRKKII